MPNPENPLGQLHKKLPDLQKSPEVSDAVGKHKRLTEEKVPNTPEARLEVYMERLEKIFLNEDEDTRKRNIKLLLPKIHEAFVIKPEDVPESYFELQQRIARERGQPVETIPDETKEQMKKVIIEDQKQSLDQWIDYLSSDDAMYPTWFKYFVFRNITKLSQFDKEHRKFKERTKSTTASFPDIYREPLAQVCDMYERVAKGDPATLNNPEFQEFIGKKFPAQYAMLIQKALEQSQENREQIAGQWVKYAKGDMDGAKRLYDSLQGKGTGWCTAGESTAQAQLKNGDFYVYYTNDAGGNPVSPRLAIRMSGASIGEVRGILPHQGVEPLLQDVLDSKLSEFGSEANAYRKKSADMKRLTELEKTMQSKKAITKDDLLFLYEVNDSIDGFGYGKDPRIQSLQALVTKEQAAELLSLDEAAVEVYSREVNDATVLYLPRIKEFLATVESPNNPKERYEKLLSQQKRLNSIARKTKSGTEPSVEDLRMIYEIDEKFEGFEQFQTGLAELLSKRNLAEDFKVIFGPDTKVARSIKAVDDSTTVLFMDGEVRQKSKDQKRFEHTAKCNSLSKRLESGEEITREDLVFICGANEVVFPFGKVGELERGVHFLIEKAKKSPYFEKALGLKREQIAYTPDEITEDTVLYVPEIAGYLSDDTKPDEYGLKKEATYHRRINNEKTVRRIAKKLDAGEDLTKEEIQFVFRESDRLPFPYTTKYEALEEKALRERVSQKNIETVLGSDLAQALREKPAALREYGYYGGTRDEHTYFPYFESRDDGSFLLCASVGVEQLESLRYLDAELRETGYKLASGAELKSFLEGSDLFLETDEREVYGSGYIWKKNLWNRAKDEMEQKVGHLLSLDDERLQGEDIVSSQVRKIDGYTETQRALVAITKVVDDGLEKYDIDKNSDSLDAIEDKVVRKTRKK